MCALLQALGMKEAIDVNRAAFVAQASMWAHAHGVVITSPLDGTASVPTRMLMSEPQFGGTTLIKPAFIQAQSTTTSTQEADLIGGFGMKVVQLRILQRSFSHLLC
jgi:hypothetical protein